MINDYEATKPITEDATPISTTSVDNDEVISTLNGLIEICKDGQQGFKEAAEGVERSDLKTLFYEFSRQRGTFSAELMDLVRSLGGEPETDSSVTGSIHRAWINLKSAITGKDDNAILNECERGEDAAKAAYKEAAEMSLPANVLETVRTQYSSVLAAHDRIKALRDATDTSSSSASTGY